MSSFPRLLSALVAVPACLAVGCAEPPAREPSSAEPVEAAEPAERGVPIFDGETFAGWEGNQELFRVEDGAIVAGNLAEEIPRNEFLCTEQEYGDFELRLQARTSSEGANGGIQFRSHRIPNEATVVGYQADIGILPSAQNIWGALYDEARRRELLAVPDQEGLGKVYRPGDWNDYVIRAEGPRIQLWVNGYQTVDYTETDPDIELTGIIGLQVHRGPPTEIHYRNLIIETLGHATD